MYGDKWETVKINRTNCVYACAWVCTRRKEEEEEGKTREKWKNKLKAIETESDDWTRINKRVIFIDVYTQQY